MINENRVRIVIDVDGDKARAQVAGTERGFRDLKTSVLSMQSAIVAAGGAYAIGRLISGLNDVVDVASDLQEASSKFSVVFAGQTDIAQQWSQELVAAYGTSRREAAQYLSSVQDLLVPMGMAADAAGRMSNEVVRLAADLGSFNNLPTAAVMADIQSALVGNYETMKKYGVVLNEAAVQQEALRSGMIKNKNEITASVKAQSAYNLIVAGSKAAMGDFSRTSDEYANTTKRLDAAWENLSATIGTKFIKAATRAKAATADLLTELDKVLTGPDLDQQIAQAQARLEDLLKPMDQRRDEAYQRYLENEKRVEQAQLSSIELNRQSIQSWQDYDNTVRESLQTDKTELAIKNARQALEYLKDLKHFQDLAAHEQKKADLVGFGVESGQDAGRTYTKAELAAFARNADDYVDIWRRAAAERYEIMSRTYDADIELAEQARAREKLLAEARARDYTDLWQVQAEERQEVNSRALDAIIAAEEETAARLTALTARTAEAMQNNFSDLFFDAFRGELNSLADYVEAFLTSLQRAIADYYGQLATQELFGKDFKGGGLLDALFQSIGSSGSSGASLNASGYSVAQRAAGGPVEPHRLYLVGERGPELISMGDRAGYVTPSDQLGGQVAVTVNNYSQSQARVEERQGSGNRREIFVTIGNDISGGGPIARAIERRYGLMQQGRRN